MVCLTIVMNEQERKDTLRKHVRQLKEDIVKAEHKLKEAQVRKENLNLAYVKIVYIQFIQSQKDTGKEQWDGDGSFAPCNPPPKHNN